MSRFIYIFSIISIFISPAAAANYVYDSPVCATQDYRGCSLFADISFLYWQAHLKGLEFAYVSMTDIDNTTSPKGVDTQSSISKPDCTWDPGVRASIGYTWWNPCDPCACIWSTVLTGTYLPFRSITNVSVPLVFTEDRNELLSPLFNQPFSGYAAESAKACYELDFGTLDLVTRVSLYPCKCLELSPNFGLRGAWITQKFTVNYNDIFFPILDGSSITWPNTNTSFNSQYKAIGLKGGIDFSVPILCGFSLIGNTGGSLLYGHSHIKETINGVHQETDSNSIPALAISHIVNRETECKLTKTCESELGLGWQSCLKCFRFMVSASYYFSIWFDQNDFINSQFTVTPVTDNDLLLNFTDISRRYGNLTMQGLILKTEFAF